MKKLVCFFIIMSLAGFAMAHWDEGDGHKMHYPQLPDPIGWDVNATYPNVLADDWLCTQTGWIWDIHFWGSWHGDIARGMIGTITSFHLSIHEDIPAGTGGIDYSRPGTSLLEHDFFQGDFQVRWYGEGPQGWYDPITGWFEHPDHYDYYQYNIFLPIELRIPQEQGTIYWLDVSATVEEPDLYWGWKTSMSGHFMDDAVWCNLNDPFWEPLCYPPDYGVSIDLAFVINGDVTLPVELSAFTGECLNNVPTLYWVTQSEIDNIGWYVYRSTEDSFATAEKISNLINGYGSTSEPHSYIYEDKMIEAMPGDVYWYWIESVDLGGEVHHFNSVRIEILDGSEHPSPTKPVIYALQNSPNPFRGSTEIRFTLSEPALAEVTIYNILGEKVKTLPLVLASEDTEASAYWNGRDKSGEEVSSGIYFYILKAGKSTYSGKMILLK